MPKPKDHHWRSIAELMGKYTKAQAMKRFISGELKREFSTAFQVDWFGKGERASVFMQELLAYCSDSPNRPQPIVDHVGEIMKRILGPADLSKERRAWREPPHCQSCGRGMDEILDADLIQGALYSCIFCPCGVMVEVLTGQTVNDDNYLLGRQALMQTGDGDLAMLQCQSANQMFIRALQYSELRRKRAAEAAEVVEEKPDGEVIQ